MKYTVEQRGEEYGWPGAWTIFRNGQAIEHCSSESTAWTRVSEIKAAEVASGERTPSRTQEALGWGSSR